MKINIPSTDIGNILGFTAQGVAQIIRGFDFDKSKAFFEGRTRCLTPTATREVFLSRGFNFPRTNVSFYANKGGTGKTTLSINIAYRAVQLGAKVLLCDLDMQANATNTFINYIPEFVFIDIFSKKISIEKTIIKLGENFDLLPSSLANASLELELINKNKNPLNCFTEIFKPIRDDYDLVIIDLAPSLSHISYLAVLFSDTVYIPSNPDIYSAQGIEITWGTIKEIEKSFPEKNLKVYIAWNKYNSSETQSLRFIADLKKHNGLEIAPAIVRVDSSLKNAQAEGKSIYQLKKRGSSSLDIDALTYNLLGLSDFFNQNNKRTIQ
ncbi:MAG: AAA family ATPase [Oligoflexia bacterium]|nr:AAA family ATPase [Oligoflexia bacterium]